MKKKLIMGMTVASMVANPMAVYAADLKNTPTNTNNVLEEAPTIQDKTEYQEVEQAQAHVSQLEEQQQSANIAVEETKAHYDNTTTTKELAEKEKNDKELQAYQQVLNQHNLVIASEKDFNQNTETLRLLETDLLTKESELSTANETFNNASTRLLEAQKNAALANEKMALQKQTVDEKQALFTKATQDETLAQDQLNKAQEDLKVATTVQEDAKQAYDLADKTYQEKSHLVVEAKQAVDQAKEQADLYKDDTALVQNVTTANTNYQQALSDQTKAKEEANKRKAVLDEKTQAVTLAQGAVEQAQNDVLAKEAEKKNLEQELASLTQTVDFTQAQEELENTQKALQQAQDDYNQANASLKTAQNNLNELNNEIAEQEKNVAALKTAYENSTTAEANSFKGFLNYVKAQNASNSTLIKAIDYTLQMFSDKTYSDPYGMWNEFVEITQFTHMGEKDDASSLENIKNSIEMLKMTNALRASKNDPDIKPLKVAYEEMASAIINANANGRYKYGHTGALWGGENIAYVSSAGKGHLFEAYRYYKFNKDKVWIDDPESVSQADYNNPNFIKYMLSDTMTHNGLTKDDVDKGIDENGIKLYQKVGFTNYTEPYLYWYNQEQAVKTKYPTQADYDNRKDKKNSDQDYHSTTGHLENLLDQYETTGVAYINVPKEGTNADGKSFTYIYTYYAQRFNNYPKYGYAMSVDEFEQQLNDYQTYLNNTKTNYDNAYTQLTSLTNKKSTLEQEIQTRKETVQQKDNAVKQAQVAQESAQKRVDEIKQNGSPTDAKEAIEKKLESVENELRDAKNTLATLQQNLTILTSKKNDAVSNYNQQLDIVKEKDHAVDSYKTAYDEATKTLNQFHNDQKLAQENLTSKQNAYKKALEEQEKAQADLTFKQAELKSATTSQSEAQDKVTQAIKQYEEARNQTKAKKEELDEATRILTELVNAHDNLKEALEKKELASEEVKVLEQEKSGLEEKIVEVKKTNAALKEAYYQNNNTYQRYLSSYNAIHNHNLLNNDSSLFNEYQQAMQLYQQAVLVEANARIAYEKALQQAETINQQLIEAKQVLEVKTKAYNDKLKELFALLNVDSEIQHHYDIEDYDLYVQIITLQNAKSGLDQDDIAKRLYNKENIEVKVIYDKDANSDDVYQLSEYAHMNAITPLDYFTLSIMLKTADGISSITSLSQPMTFSIDISSYLKPGRTFYLLRLHNGLIERIDLKQEGNTLIFTNDKYSSFLLGYKDIPTTTIQPKATTSAPTKEQTKVVATGDNTSLESWMLTLIASAGMAFVLRKKRRDSIS